MCLRKVILVLTDDASNMKKAFEHKYSFWDDDYTFDNDLDNIDFQFPSNLPEWLYRASQDSDDEAEDLEEYYIELELHNLMNPAANPHELSIPLRRSCSHTATCYQGRS